MTSSAPARTRSCAYCRTEMGRGFGPACPGCGWTMGLIPVGETRDSSGAVTTQFVAESPVRYGRLALLVVTVGGAIAFLSGLSSSAGVAALGSAALSLGIYVWRQTRFARVMYGLTPGKRLLCRAVLVVGTVIIFCTVVGIAMNVVADRSARSLF